METIIQYENDNIVALLQGRLDTAAAVKTEQEIKPLYDCEGRDIILDCTQLQYISSSGLRIFLGVLKAATLKKSHVFITGLNQDLKKVFDITGFTNLFEMK
ncbi:MAG: STAS domain-containing protein [Prevotella sp.]|nr:STAS domain-containing protein [Prevotella sp.]